MTLAACEIDTVGSPDDVTAAGFCAARDALDGVDAGLLLDGGVVPAIAGLGVALDDTAGA